jgi:glucose-1-phosphate thymidylyltransferase
VIVGVVPAAGMATRLQPLASSKEVLPIRGRPVIDYLLERMWAGGAEEIRVVTRPDKEDVARHAEREGALVVLAEPASVCESLLAGLDGVAEGDVVLLGFPDTIWEPVDGFRPLVRALGSSYDVALGLFTGLEPERSDVVTIDERGTVLGVEIKPAQPESSLIWGCAAARAHALLGLERHAEPGEYFDELARRGTVTGIHLSDTFGDIGTPEALERLTTF